MIDKLSEHKKQHSKEYYDKIRSKNDLKEPLERAARFIYLNKTCYNGLYRVNKKGAYNVPMGSYSNPHICDQENLLKCSKALKNVTIDARPFDEVKVEEHSCVYCDPPYHETYNQYTRDKFGEKQQIKLSEFAVDLIDKGCQVVISNSDTAFIRELYTKKYFDIHEIEAPRSVSCKGDERKNTTELLIVSKC